MPLAEINPGLTSGVLFWTSNLASTYTWAETESPGGSAAVSDVPTVPVPATRSLLVAGLAGGTRLLRHRS
jgi:hypothetical protein